MGSVRTSLAALIILTFGCGVPPTAPEEQEPEQEQEQTNVPPPEELPEGQIAASAVKPNVLLLIDRSCSMAEPSDCGEASCPSKWQELLALSAYLREAKDLARLGAAFFPADGSACNAGTSLDVPLSEAPNVDEQITNAARATRPGGQTPIAAALDAIGNLGVLEDPDRDNILLLLTDGRPTCGCADRDPACERDVAVSAVERLVARSIHVDLDVIGFSASARDAQDTLTAMAQAAGDDAYYQADSIEALIGTLYEVSVNNVPCKFLLDELPEPERLIVWKDGEQVPACTADPCADGYVYDRDAGTVELQGDACAAMRDGESHNVWFETVE